MADPGIILAILSAVFNGSFVAFAKLRSVAACELHPVLFNFYVTLGVFLSCFIAAPFFPLVGARFELDALGALAGALFVFAASFSFIAASLVGLSTGQGVWCAAAILVSFLWGTVGPAPIGKPLGSVPLSVAALAVIIVGVLGIVQSENLASLLRRCFGCPTADAFAAAVDGFGETAAPEGMEVADGGVAVQVSSGKRSRGASSDAGSLALRHAESGVSDVQSSVGTDALMAAGATKPSGFTKLAGLGAALAVGVFGGSILVPDAFVDAAAFSVRQPASDAIAIALLPSFGFGALVCACLFTGLWYSYVTFFTNNPPPELHVRGTLWAGLCSGVVWNLGNISSLLAMKVYGVPFGIAYPILQCALVVGGLIGIFGFGEIKDKLAILIFLLADALVIAGAVLLGAYGPGTA